MRSRNPLCASRDSTANWICYPFAGGRPRAPSAALQGPPGRTPGRCSAAGLRRLRRAGGQRSTGGGVGGDRRRLSVSRVQSANSGNFYGSPCLKRSNETSSSYLLPSGATPSEPSLGQQVLQVHRHPLSRRSWALARRPPGTSSPSRLWLGTLWESYTRC